jgi:hypothetical protein
LQEIGVPAFVAAKIQIFSMIIQVNALSPWKIYLTNRIFDHEIIHLIVCLVRQALIYRSADLFHKLTHLEKSIDYAY